MIAKMYKRREKLAFVLLCITLIMLVVYVGYVKPQSWKEWLEASALLLPMLFLVSVFISSRNKFNQVKELSIPEADVPIIDSEHVVWKPDAAFIPRLLAFQKNGAYAGVLEPVNIPRWLQPLVWLRNSVLFMAPSTFSFYNKNGEEVFRLKRRGFKETTVTISDGEGTHLGNYVQEEFKSFLYIKGEIQDNKGNTLLPVKTSSFSGDFSLYDEHDHRWAHFYNGRFPHEYTKIFRDIDNDIVELSDQLTNDHKILLLGTISFLFMQRTINQ